MRPGEIQWEKLRSSINMSTPQPFLLLPFLFPFCFRLIPSIHRRPFNNFSSFSCSNEILLRNRKCYPLHPLREPRKRGRMLSNNNGKRASLIIEEKPGRANLLSLFLGLSRKSASSCRIAFSSPI